MSHGVGLPRGGVIPRVPDVGAAGDAAVRRELMALRGYLGEVAGEVEDVLDHLSRVLGTPHPMRKVEVTGVAPAAGIDTYGTATEILPTDGFGAIALFRYVALTSGGTFGAETLTVRLTVYYSDLTTGTITKTFVAAGVETALTEAELYALLKEGVSMDRLTVEAKSSIGSSAARGGAKVGGLNG